MAVTAPAGSGIPADSPLTTKEGWAAFVRHAAGPAGAAARGRCRADHAACDEARREYHADLPLVSTPVLQKVISTCRLLIQLNRHQVSARRGRDRQRRVRHRQDHRADPARPHPRARHAQPASRR